MKVVRGASARAWAVVPAVWFAGAAFAQQAATPPAAGASSAFLSLLQVVAALVVVLAVIALFAWMMRRLSPGGNLGGGLLKVRGGVMLGPKERAVLLEVDDTWIVVGVGSGQVNALHAMPRPPNAHELATHSAESTRFSTWLQRAIREKSLAKK